MTNEQTSTMRVNAPTLAQRVRDNPRVGKVVASPKLVWNTLILTGLSAVLGLTMYVAREHPKVAAGEIASTTRASRVSFEMTDKAGTESDRELARSRAPSVYLGDAKIAEEARVSLENLPRALANAKTIDEVERSIREQFGLTPDSLAAVKAEFDSEKNAPTDTWLRRVDRLDKSLQKLPIVDEKTFQREATNPSKVAELRITLPAAAVPVPRPVVVNPAGENGPKSEPASVPKGEPGVSKAEEAAAKVDAAASGATKGVKPIETRTMTVVVPTGEVVSVMDEKLGERLDARIATAGFMGELRRIVLARLLSGMKPTFVYDETMSKEIADRMAKAVPARRAKIAQGQLLYAPGDEITQDKLETLRAEVSEWRKNGEPRSLWAATIALWGAGVLSALGLAGYVATYAPAIWRVPRRLLAVSLISAGAVALGSWIAMIEPRLMVVALTSPVLAATMLIAVAFERRTALALGSLAGIAGCVALEQPVVMVGLPLCAVWLAVWRLKEFRQRDSLVKTGLIAGLALIVATVALEGLHLPMSGPGLLQTINAACFAGGGALLTSFIVLGLLPLIERVFGITTGMTLIELRDPKQPLLRELQQRAPGTYNHSLNVASLAEAAADAIGADSLLTYVGALYHDVGKMTKPEFFVENQMGGINRHDKMAPAMSLLIITGHVKEGIELAREHGLPKPLWHFIESHHGTTLVEYFYHRARRAAEASGTPAADLPTEIEYRYAGPRPRTREAAILMVCDASESATRTLADPSPTKIDALVRAIAHKRLMDGQFDNAEITLKDLNLIIEAVGRTLAAIHHQRIAYPEQGAMAIRGPQTGAGVAVGAGVGGAGSVPGVSLPSTGMGGAGVVGLGTRAG